MFFKILVYGFIESRGKDKKCIRCFYCCFLLFCIKANVNIFRLNKLFTFVLCKRKFTTLLLAKSVQFIQTKKNEVEEPTPHLNRRKAMNFYQFVSNINEHFFNCVLKSMEKFSLKFILVIVYIRMFLLKCIPKHCRIPMEKNIINRWFSVFIFIFLSYVGCQNYLFIKWIQIIICMVWILLSEMQAAAINYNKVLLR